MKRTPTKALISTPMLVTIDTTESYDFKSEFSEDDSISPISTSAQMTVSTLTHNHVIIGPLYDQLYHYDQPSKALTHDLVIRDLPSHQFCHKQSVSAQG